MSIFQIFSGVYIFQTIQSFGATTQQSLAMTAFFFSLAYLVHALSITPALWIISRKGLRFSVFWGNIFLIAFLVLVYLGKFDPIVFIPAAICFGIQIGLYWTAYHIFFTELSDDKKQGEEISIGTSLSSIAAIGAPAFGGMIINFSGFGILFLIMAILFLVACIPLQYIPKQKDIVPIDILQIITALSPKKEEKSYLSLFGAGIIDCISSTFWPIFVFPIVSGFLGIGFIGSLAAFFSTITVIALGYSIDRFGAKRVIAILSPIDSIVWLLRAFVYTPFQTILVSAIQSLTTAGQLLGVNSLVYERARHTNIVAFIVQHEVGMSLGRFLFLLWCGLLLWFGLPFSMVFIMTALITLSSALYPSTRKAS